MKRLFIGALVLLTMSCKEENITLEDPSNVSQVMAEPIVGGAIVRWDLPTDSNFLYLEVSYLKKDQLVTTKVSKYTDSVVIEGLLNKLDYTFNVQAFNANEDAAVGGEALTTNSVKPIRRPIQTKYFEDDLTKIEGITDDMVETFTQESSEGPKVNLFDGDVGTFWHSAWSSGVAPLPHWIVVHFPEEKEVGAVKYFFRQNASTNGRPSQLGLETSEDGVNWERQWTSDAGMPVTPTESERTLTFDKNYKAKHFRLMILETSGNTTYAHLGELSFFSMRAELTDMEELAEENY